jgi:aminotransferase
MTNRSDRTALRTRSFSESVIREMTRVARKHDAVNLSQGFPDFPAPDLLKEAACAAIRDNINQYAITWGSQNLRDALARKYDEHYGMDVDTEREITVTCGGTEAMASVMMGVINPGEEVIIMEPFYENYGPDVVLCQANPVFLPLESPDYRLDRAMLEEAITPKTRAIIINTPNNPTGRVFDREELQTVADLCIEHDILAITDEIYEHIYYEGEHVPLATFDGMRDRTITISGLSKTFSITGWRVGTIIAPPDLTAAIRKVHDFLTVGAPAPLQEACAVGLNELPREYYTGMVARYRERGDILIEALQESGFKCTYPQGAYYILADFSDISDEDSMTFAHRMTADGGVASVPGGSFFREPERGHSLTRFVFCKELDTLREASKRLKAFAAEQ